MANKPWVVLLCKFNDVAAIPHEPIFYERHFTQIGNGTLSEFEYWRDISYGNFDLSESRVFGWLSMNDHSKADLLKLTMPRDRNIVVSWATKAAADAGIDLSPFAGTIAVVNASTDVGVAA